MIQKSIWDYVTPDKLQAIQGNDIINVAFSQYNLILVPISFVHLDNKNHPGLWGIHDTWSYIHIIDPEKWKGNLNKTQFHVPKLTFDGFN